MKKAALALVSAALILSLAACGGSKEDTSSSGNANVEAKSEVTLTASNFKFDQEEYRVKAGEPVKFTLNITEGVHGAEIKDLGVKLDMNSKSQVVTPDKAGTYEIVCSIPCGAGHADMHSKLVVE